MTLTINWLFRDSGASQTMLLIYTGSGWLQMYVDCAWNSDGLMPHSVNWSVVLPQVCDDNEVDGFPTCWSENLGVSEGV